MFYVGTGTIKDVYDIASFQFDKSKKVIVVTITEIKFQGTKPIPGSNTVVICDDMNPTVLSPKFTKPGGFDMGNPSTWGMDSLPMEPDPDKQFFSKFLDRASTNESATIVDNFEAGLFSILVEMGVIPKGIYEPSK
jgi:hypothetical protein